MSEYSRPLPVNESNQTAPAPDGQHGKAISIRKLIANRRNAKKSTGPKTSQGKAYSRRNALKHGLFARPLWEFGLLGEDPAEREQLQADLFAEYQPIGRAEEFGSRAHR